MTTTTDLGLDPIRFVCDHCTKPAEWMHPGGKLTCNDHKERI